MKLKDAVKRHVGNDWIAISALVPDRSINQCRSRWHNVLDPSIDGANGRAGKWIEDEDIKLKDAVKRHGGNNWIAISALVPDRSINQCRSRWRYVLDPGIGGANRRAGKWIEEEDSKLKDAVQMHGEKDWAEIAALVPDRSRSQCRGRWHNRQQAEGCGTNAR
jgi:hypothetical protein